MAALVPGEKARMYAQLGVMRVGASRLGYADGRVYISFGGTHIGWAPSGAWKTIYRSLQITPALDEQPDTCTFRIHGGAPAEPGAEVIVTLGSKNRLTRLFAGFALTITQRYAAQNPKWVQADVHAVDYTWLLGFQLVTKRYVNQNAATIAKDLIATYAAANGFTTTHVAADLPVLDAITFTNEDLPAALTRLARRAGAYWFVDYQKDLHFFFIDEGSGQPTTLTPAHPTFRDFTRDGERTQALARVYVEGRGSRILGPVAVGDTKIPLEAADMFQVAADVFAKVSFQGSEGGAEHLSYSGVLAGGKGALVGPGIGPSAAPTLALQAGAGVDAGTHGYAVTFTTAAGESLPSPVASISAGASTNPTVPPTVTFFQTAIANGNFMTIGDTVRFGYGWAIYTGSSPYPETLVVQSTGTYVLPSNNDPYNPQMVAGINFTAQYSTDPRITDIIIWMYSTARGGWGRASGFKNNPAGGTALYSIMGGGYGQLEALPAANTTTAGQIAVSGIAVGSGSVTGRKLYRTAANQAPLKLLTTLADNTTTTYVDTKADSTLGAAVPASDTSGLQQPPGQVLPGATTLPIAGTGGFEAAGGWASIGNGEQVIRYTGLTGGSLTGIPASGVGAITAAVAYNSTVTAPAMLTGIPATGPRSIQIALTGGDEVYLVVQVDSSTVKDALAGMGAGNGIREEWVQDRRLSIPEARARGQATLAVRPATTTTINYRCRDVLTAVGKTIRVDLPAPTNVQGTFRIQSVTISNFRPRAPQLPTYTVVASSQRFNFDDWLRQMRTKE